MTLVLPAKRSREKESEQWGGQQEGKKTERPRAHPQKSKKKGKDVLAGGTERQF